MYTRTGLVLGAVAAILVSGCAPRNVDFAQIQRPDRAAELEALDVFVGSWVWEAEVVNAEGEGKDWKGTAEWRWTLDDRCLHGVLSAKSTQAAFDAAGDWTWHPQRKRYEWSMYNNWGYPQHGTAKYDAETKTWTMKYKSVGLDGTTSHGLYEMKVVGDDLLEWRNEEWADPMYWFKKIEMKGVYKRGR